jgi:hypothetical protein
MSDILKLAHKFKNIEAEFYKIRRSLEPKMSVAEMRAASASSSQSVAARRASLVSYSLSGIRYGASMVRVRFRAGIACSLHEPRRCREVPMLRANRDPNSGFALKESSAIFLARSCATRAAEVHKEQVGLC